MPAMTIKKPPMTAVKRAGDGTWLLSEMIDVIDARWLPVMRCGSS
jgi:hypothetical protein